MSVNIWEVYLKCPACGEVTTAYDYHENTSSENIELFCVLNVGKQSRHFYSGDPLEKAAFLCPHCGRKTPYDDIFTPDNCRVEDLGRYKQTLLHRLQWADRDGRVSFSDWDRDWDEEPALSRLIAMYPEDADLRRIREIYRRLHQFGKRALTRLEFRDRQISRDAIPVPEMLESVYLYNEVESIGPHAFENCKALRDIFLPDSVTEIGEYAFSGSGLQKIHVSNGLVSIGKKAFSGTGIPRFFFPEAVRDIGEECFAGCRHLNDLWIPPEAKIGRNAFAGCEGLKRIRIAASVPAEVAETWGLGDSCTIERYEP